MSVYALLADGSKLCEECWAEWNKESTDDWATHHAEDGFVCSECEAHLPVREV